MENREEKIIKILIKKKRCTVSQISKQLGLSEKTVSNSLKDIDLILKDYDLKLVRKPKVGVYIEGDTRNIVKRLETNRLIETDVPSTKGERIIYLCTKLLNTNEYMTIQKLSDELFISRGTIERELSIVEEVFAQAGVEIERRPSKGIKVIGNEVSRRAVIVTIISKFWSDNWYLEERNQSLEPSFQKMKMDLDGLFSEEIINDVFKVLKLFVVDKDYYFSDYAFQSFVIYLVVMIERIKNGKYVSSDIELEMGENLKDAKELAQMLDDAFNIKLPKDEIYYMNSHLLANKKGLKVKARDIQSLSSQHLKNLLESALEDYDEELITGLETHINAALNRIAFSKSINNPYKDSVIKNYPLAFESALVIKKVIEEHYRITLSDHEVSYIAIHIQAFNERNQEVKKNITALIVCSTGVGTSRLLATRISRSFPSIQIKKILSLQELKNIDIDVDLIISTIYFEMERVPVIVVSPLLEKNERYLIDNHIEELRKDKERTSSKEFQRLLTRENVLIKENFNNQNECLSFICNHLVTNGYGEKGILESALNREKLSSTAQNDLALPHCEMKFVKKSTIVIVKLKNKLLWGTKEVDKIFFIALTEKDQLDLNQVYETFYDLLDNQNKLNSILDNKDSHKIYEQLIKGV